MRNQIYIKFCNEFHRYYSFIMILTLCMAAFNTVAYATGGDLWSAASTLIEDIYKGIAGISTVLAGCMSAIAVLGAKMSNNQHKVDQAWDWLKRVWIAWGVINGIGAFIAYIYPLFNDYRTITPPGSSGTPAT